MFAELEPLLQKVLADSDSLAVLVVQSRSPKYFLGGANLQMLKDLEKGLIPDFSCDLVSAGLPRTDLLNRRGLPVCGRGVWTSYDPHPSSLSCSTRYRRMAVNNSF